MSREIQRPSGVKLWQIPVPPVREPISLLPFLGARLPAVPEAHEASYFAASARISNFVSILSDITNIIILVLFHVKNKLRTVEKKRNCFVAQPLLKRTLKGEVK